MSSSSSQFTHKEPCPACGSRDNLARYSDGHGYCFGCQYYEHAESSQEPSGDTEPSGGTMGAQMIQKPARRLTGRPMAIEDRRLTKETCDRYGVQCTLGPDGNISSHIYPYFDSQGVHVGDKVRDVETKGFISQGDLKSAGLFGQQLWQSKRGGKYITVTEGELDALAVSQMFGNKYPTVSLRTGAGGAQRDIKNSLEFLESFDNVILCFDSDPVGQEAAQKALKLFSPRKAKNCVLPLKDASDMLKAGRSKEFLDSWWDSKEYKPDGLVSSEDTWDILTAKDTRRVVPYPWGGLNEMLKGIRGHELVTVTAGSGLGKSSVMRELIHHLWSSTKDNVGIMMLEESVQRSVAGVLGVHVSKPLHDPAVYDSMPEEDIRKAWEDVMGSGRMVFFDHFGSTDEENLLGRLRFMAKGMDCKYIILDHLSIVVSGMEGENERQLIDRLMTKLRTLVQETGVCLFLVSHLRRPQGDKGHEEGSAVSMSQLRGSHAIAQLSDTILGLERNGQHDDPLVRNTTRIRVLKNRAMGFTGLACALRYDAETARLHEVPLSEAGGKIPEEDLEF